MNAVSPIQAADGLTAISTADVAPSDLHIRWLASAVLNGQFDGLPLNLFSKVDWVDAAQALADVEGEPIDEAQAVAEIELMLAKSDYLANRWDYLSERDKERWGDFETFFDAKDRFAPVGARA